MTTADIVKLAVPSLLSVASLLWNLANSYRTTKIARESFAANVALDEFKNSLRQPVRDALKELGEFIKTVQILIYKNGSFEDKDHLIDLNRSVALSLSNLVSVLQNCDTSKNCSGSTYSSAAEQHQDCMVGYFNTSMNEANSVETRLNALKQIPAEYNKFSKYISQCFEEEVRQLSPSTGGFLQFYLGEKKKASTTAFPPYKTTKQ